MNALEVKNLSFKYNKSEEYVLKDVNFRAKSGETLAIIGQSGCGKSTLCNLICGLIPKLYKGQLSG